MASLPLRLPKDQMETAWASKLEPILNSVIADSSILSNVTLKAGVTSINHLLSRKLQGYIVIGKDAPANIYDSQAKNPTPALTLVLNSDVACTVSLMVF